MSAEEWMILGVGIALGMLLGMILSAWLRDHAWRSKASGQGSPVMYSGEDKPNKMKPVFHCEGAKNARHPFGTELTADWHDVNQAIAALCNDGYETVTVRREMVPE